MNIIVCIKQVPDTDDIKWTKENTIDRENIESILNPCDEYAINLALLIKERLVSDSVKIVALTMGPKSSERILRNALSLGVDRVILLSDKKFQASDTFATATVIAKAIREKIADFDLIICGQKAIDGDTSQTGPSIASILDIPNVTNVKKVIDINQRDITVEKETKIGSFVLNMRLKGLICVNTFDKELKEVKIDGYIKAQDAQIECYNIDDLELDSSEVGFLGSKTIVKRAFRPNGTFKQCKFIESKEDTFEFLKRQLEHPNGD